MNTHYMNRPARTTINAATQAARVAQPVQHKQPLSLTTTNPEQHALPDQINKVWGMMAWARDPINRARFEDAARFKENQRMLLVEFKSIEQMRTQRPDEWCVRHLECPPNMMTSDTRMVIAIRVETVSNSNYLEVWPIGEPARLFRPENDGRRQ